MQIAQTNLKDIFNILKNVTTEYSLLCPRGGKESIKSIEYFSDYCKSIAKIDIYQHDIYWAPPYPRGLTLAYHDSYKIWMLKGLNPCWSRFVLCKELFHVLIDAGDKEKIFSNKDIGSHIEKYLETNHFEKTPNNIQAELLAEIAAIEFMFPYAHRVKQANIPSADTAETYKIPKSLVEKYCSLKSLEFLKLFDQI
jgi:hypothetical protein